MVGESVGLCVACPFAAMMYMEWSELQPTNCGTGTKGEANSRLLPRDHASNPWGRSEQLQLPYYYGPTF